MKSPTPSPPPAGFTLVLTLIILSAITIVVIGLFSATAAENAAAASHEAVERTELALQAGLAHVSGLITEITFDDQFIIYQDSDGVDANNRPLSHLVAARPNAAYDEWTCTPLVSGTRSTKADFPTANLPVEPKAGAESAQSTLRVLPWQAKPAAYWETVDTDPNATVTSRYAFWVEDLQGQLNLQAAGNSNGPGGVHKRTAVSNTDVPAFVPGLNLTGNGQPLLNQSALYTLVKPEAAEDSAAIAVDNWLIEHRKTLVSPDMWKAVSLKKSFPPASLIRQSNGFFPLDDTCGNAANLLETHTTAGTRPYKELPLIPGFATGFAGMGSPKLNLNQVIHDIKNAEISPDEGVTQIARHIRRHLPYFEQRAGGYPFPEAGNEEEKRFTYLKALAAGIIDYADEDSQSTILEGHYRGIDSFPLVNEYFISQQVQELSATRVRWSVITYAELWNMTNKPITGTVQGSFEHLNPVKIGNDDPYRPSAPSAEADSGFSHMADPKPEETDGLFWHAPVGDLSFQPNEYKLVKIGEVTFDYPINLGPDATGPAEIAVAKDNYNNRYRLKFKGENSAAFTLVDRPRGTVERGEIELKMDTSGTRIKNISVNVASAYGIDSSATSNVGDPRAAFYLGAIGTAEGDNKVYQSVTSYTGGTSPGGRNLRHNLTSNFTRNETRPHLWPDGGHATDAGTKINSAIKLPDQIASVAPESPPKFLQLISNAGRLYSVTELGNIFDPHMWLPAAYDKKFGTVHHFADLAPGDAVTASPHYCGGNTLRIGRPEHSRWRPDYRSTPEAERPTDRRYSASSLLDLFHTGIPTSSDEDQLAGHLIEILPGCINVNTATRDTLRAILAGKLQMDPNSTPSTILPSKNTDQADILAQAVIKNRPYLSPAELADKVCDAGQHQPLFGNPDHLAGSSGMALADHELNDPALEELFARLFNNSTVRSRNFRVYITAQALRHTRSGNTVIEAARSRVYHIFVEPERDANGNMTRQHIRMTYVRNL